MLEPSPQTPNLMKSGVQVQPRAEGGRRGQAGKLPRQKGASRGLSRPRPHSHWSKATLEPDLPPGPSLGLQPLDTVSST